MKCNFFGFWPEKHQIFFFFYLENQDFQEISSFDKSEIVQIGILVHKKVENLWLRKSSRPKFKINQILLQICSNSKFYHFECLPNFQLDLFSNRFCACLCVRPRKGNGGVWSKLKSCFREKLEKKFCVFSRNSQRFSTFWTISTPTSAIRAEFESDSKRKLWLEDIMMAVITGKTL